MAKANVSKLLTEIEAALPALIVSTVRATAPKEPVYAVIVCYSDNTSNDHMPFVLVCPERVREWVRKHGAITYDIWKPQVELSGSAELFTTKQLSDRGLKTKVMNCYDLLTDAGDADESVLLLPFRKMLWRVAHNLNLLDWKTILQPTDDFALIVSDESGFQVEEDARNSVPANLRQLLESRGCFFNEHSDDERAGEQATKYAKLDAVLATLAADKHVAYLSEQLLLIGKDEGSPVADDWVLLARLESIGYAAVLPLLDLAQSLSILPDRKGKQPTASGVLLQKVLSCVAIIGRKDLVVERRLRGLLEEAVDANQPREKWSRMPFLCAQALQELFDYPWAVQGWEKDQLRDVDKYLNVPFKSTV